MQSVAVKLKHCGTCVRKRFYWKAQFKKKDRSDNAASPLPTSCQLTEHLCSCDVFVAILEFRNRAIYSCVVTVVTYMKCFARVSIRTKHGFAVGLRRSVVRRSFLVFLFVHDFFLPFEQQIRFGLTFDDGSIDNDFLDVLETRQFVHRLQKDILENSA